MIELIIFFGAFIAIAGLGIYHWGKVQGKW